MSIVLWVRSRKGPVFVVGDLDDAASRLAETDLQGYSRFTLDRVNREFRVRPAAVLAYETCSPQSSERGGV